MESIVRIPKNSTIDYDYIAFSFDNLHSYEDMGIVRVSDGDRYNDKLTPTLKDSTVDVPGGDGMYYFKTHHKQKVFDINFAFEDLDEAGITKLKKWLNGKNMGDLWFAEAPYKVYTAKVTGQPTLKTICFEEDGKRIYKGEGTVQFTAYWPYAHTPDKIQRWDDTDKQWVNVGSGIVYTNYSGFANYNQILSELPGYNGNCGDLPFTFVAELINPNSETTSKLSLDITDTVHGLSIIYENVEQTQSDGVVTIETK